jgi:hypothetical protein
MLVSYGQSLCLSGTDIVLQIPFAFCPSSTAASSTRRTERRARSCRSCLEPARRERGGKEGRVRRACWVTEHDHSKISADSCFSFSSCACNGCPKASDPVQAGHRIASSLGSTSPVKAVQRESLQFDHWHFAWRLGQDRCTASCHQHGPVKRSAALRPYARVICVDSQHPPCSGSGSEARHVSSRTK